MYAALWRILPGPWWVRLLILLAILAAVLYVLFDFVFPWIDALMNPDNTGTVGT